MIIDLTLEELPHFFDLNYISRGISYAEQGMVLKTQAIENQQKIVATVKGSGNKNYICTLSLGQLPSQIQGHCSCPIGYNCKHIVAVLVDHLQHQYQLPFHSNQQGDSRPHAPSDNWLSSLNGPATHLPANDKLHFLLDIETSLTLGRHLVLTTIKSKKLKSGLWAKGSKHRAGSNSSAAFLTTDDIALLRFIEAVADHYDAGKYPLTGPSVLPLLEMILQTGRSHWQEINRPALCKGEDSAGELDWRLKGKDLEIAIVNQPDKIVLPLEPLMYLDGHQNSVGRLITQLEKPVAQVLAMAPAIPAEQAAQVKEGLQRRFPNSSLPLPSIEVGELRTDINPTPCLRLFSTPPSLGDYSIENDFIDLQFKYAGTLVPAGHKSEEPITQNVGNKIERIERQIDKEAEVLNVLFEYDFELAEFHEQPDNALRFYSYEGEAGWFWLHDQLDALRAAGWEITIDPSFRFSLVKPDEWYAELDADDREDWFDLELGVKIKDKMVSLLPVLVAVIQQQKQAKTLQGFLDQADSAPVYVRLTNTEILTLELGKVRHIIETLVELYDPNSLDTDGKLKLSRYQAGQLSSLAEADLVWGGAEAPRLFADKLAGFKKVEKVTVPKTLKATLRPYQKQGLNWLQFLSEYGLAGILADEMGLGKTVQTIAHILKEKELGRLTAPCLVVATTSLMVNWNQELKLFAPSLKVLVSQGDKRKQHLSTFADYDVVLTTYPLLPRDQESLTEQHWHLLILDEAQYIKNPRSKVTETACKLTANHRLCLTGTPMENHLGELWSQFHFLMPGLLGHEKQFRTLFRTPIEKQSDQSRQKQLNKRIAPFLLRREKSLVAKELPEKVEIISRVELSGQQRQLYETIRLSMNERVRKEIDKKGIARSQIIILDALLKLRQVCCDPRLLKLESAKKVKNSAKLEQLMEILPEMIEEGRRVLLFSQFTSMLSLIEEALDKRKIGYVKLTGQTKDRNTPISQFQDKEVPLFLISLKAGGAGLNLTAADTVIHYDPWWNPAVEAQATDRAHRIGQKNKVFVYKFITTGTVEEKINVLQQKKKALADALFGSGKQAKKLTEDDIQALFEPLE
jgi:superfamily II DNA or RNA helicase